MKLKNFVSLIIGFLILALAFVPIGAYHGLGDMDISGTLWNFMLPTGWLSIITGIVLLIHKRISLKNKRLAYVMFSFSLLLLMLFLLQDVDYHLSLWHGIKDSNFDVDSFILTYVSAFTLILSTIAGLLFTYNS